MSELRAIKGFDGTANRDRAERVQWLFGSDVRDFAPFVTELMDIVESIPHDSDAGDDAQKEILEKIQGAAQELGPEAAVALYPRVSAFLIGRQHPFRMAGVTAANVLKQLAVRIPYEELAAFNRELTRIFEVFRKKADATLAGFDRAGHVTLNNPELDTYGPMGDIYDVIWKRATWNRPVSETAVELFRQMRGEIALVTGGSLGEEAAQCKIQSAMFWILQKALDDKHRDLVRQMLNTDDLAETLALIRRPVNQNLGGITREGIAGMLTQSLLMDEGLIGLYDQNDPRHVALAGALKKLLGAASLIDARPLYLKYRSLDTLRTLLRDRTLTGDELIRVLGNELNGMKAHDRQLFDQALQPRADSDAGKAKGELWFAQTRSLIPDPQSLLSGLQREIVAGSQRSELRDDEDTIKGLKDVYLFAGIVERTDVKKLPGLVKRLLRRWDRSKGDAVDQIRYALCAAARRMEVSSLPMMAQDLLKRWERPVSRAPEEAIAAADVLNQVAQRIKPGELPGLADALLKGWHRREWGMFYEQNARTKIAAGLAIAARRMPAKRLSWLMSEMMKHWDEAESWDDYAILKNRQNVTMVLSAISGRAKAESPLLPAIANRMVREWSRIRKHSGNETAHYRYWIASTLRKVSGKITVGRLPGLIKHLWRMGLETTDVSVWELLAAAYTESLVRYERRQGVVMGNREDPIVKKLKELLSLRADEGEQRLLVLRYKRLEGVRDLVRNPNLTDEDVIAALEDMKRLLAAEYIRRREQADGKRGKGEGDRGNEKRELWTAKSRDGEMGGGGRSSVLAVSRSEARGKKDPVAEAKQWLYSWSLSDIRHIVTPLDMAQYLLKIWDGIKGMQDGQMTLVGHLGDLAKAMTAEQVLWLLNEVMRRVDHEKSSARETYGCRGYMAYVIWDIAELIPEHRLPHLWKWLASRWHLFQHENFEILQKLAMRVESGQLAGMLTFIEEKLGVMTDNGELKHGAEAWAAAAVRSGRPGAENDFEKKIAGFLNEGGASGIPTVSLIARFGGFKALRELLQNTSLPDRKVIEILGDMKEMLVAQYKREKGEREKGKGERETGNEELWAVQPVGWGVGDGRNPVVLARSRGLEVPVFAGGWGTERREAIAKSEIRNANVVIPADRRESRNPIDSVTARDSRRDLVIKSRAIVPSSARGGNLTFPSSPGRNPIDSVTARGDLRSPSSPGRNPEAMDSRLKHAGMTLSMVSGLRSIVSSSSSSRLMSHITRHMSRFSLPSTPQSPVFARSEMRPEEEQLLERLQQLNSPLKAFAVRWLIYSQRASTYFVRAVFALAGIISGGWLIVAWWIDAFARWLYDHELYFGDGFQLEGPIETALLITGIGGMGLAMAAFAARHRYPVRLINDFFRFYDRVTAGWVVSLSRRYASQKVEALEQIKEQIQSPEEPAEPSLETGLPELLPGQPPTMEIAAELKRTREQIEKSGPQPGLAARLAEAFFEEVKAVPSGTLMPSDLSAAYVDIFASLADRLQPEERMEVATRLKDILVLQWGGDKMSGNDDLFSAFLETAVRLNLKNWESLYGDKMLGHIVLDRDALGDRAIKKRMRDLEPHFSEARGVSMPVTDILIWRRFEHAVLDPSGRTWSPGAVKAFIEFLVYRTSGQPLYDVYQWGPALRDVAANRGLSENEILRIFKQELDKLIAYRDRDDAAKKNPSSESPSVTGELWAAGRVGVTGKNTPEIRRYEIAAKSEIRNVNFVIPADRRENRNPETMNSRLKHAGMTLSLIPYSLILNPRFSSQPPAKTGTSSPRPSRSSGRSRGKRFPFPVSNRERAETMRFRPTSAPQPLISVRSEARKSITRDIAGIMAGLRSKRDPAEFIFSTGFEAGVNRMLLGWQAQGWLAEAPERVSLALISEVRGIVWGEESRPGAAVSEAVAGISASAVERFERHLEKVLAASLIDPNQGGVSLLVNYRNEDGAAMADIVQRELRPLVRMLTVLHEKGQSVKARDWQGIRMITKRIDPAAGIAMEKVAAELESPLFWGTRQVALNGVPDGMVVMMGDSARVPAKLKKVYLKATAGVVTALALLDDAERRRVTRDEQTLKAFLVNHPYFSFLAGSIQMGNEGAISLSLERFAQDVRQFAEIQKAA